MREIARISHAAPIIFTFEGIVNVDDVSGFSEFLGETLQVTYTFESTTPDADPTNPAVGEYLAITEFEVTVGGNMTVENTYTQTDPGVVRPGAAGIGVRTTGGRDLYFATGFEMTGPDVGGLTVFSWDLILSNPTNTVWMASLQSRYPLVSSPNLSPSLPHCSCSALVWQGWQL